MKATYILIVSVLMADMLITSDAGRAKKCSKKCKKFIKKLKSENQELQSTVESLRKTVKHLQEQLAENVPCSSSPCLNGGTCSNKPGGGYSCQCKSGFVGETCAEENRSCDSSPCLNGGTCANEPGGGYSCLCKIGFGGETCEENRPCDSSPCLNGGACTNEPGGGYSCQCKIGFGGKACEGALTASSILGGLDRKYLDQLNFYLLPVLKNPSSSSFVRCYHAKTNGWAASTFHSNCDGKGPTVTIIQVGNYIFGGYADMSWTSDCGYASSRKSFIFSLYNINGYAPNKLEIISGYTNYANYGCYSNGPTFGGGHDIVISNNAGSNQDSYTHCGNTYSLPQGYSSSGNSCTFYAGSFQFTPTDVEVFYEKTT